ncbi:phosphatase PAP2 family protein [Pseudaeromonas sharmana]|uniref:Phosphatase PAP2 family protein n=1 Tax=Pseudaeromonas sharmana TaxID=328412 RepID=A0ABV8CK30_9GAMM
MSSFSRLALACAIASTGLVATPAQALSHDQWDKVSDYATYSLAATALALPAWEQDWQGIKEATYSMGAGGIVSEMTKAAVHEQRPDGSGDDSFPSNHATVAFAAATNLTIRYGWDAALPSYGVASLVAVGRVEAKKHYWHDVLAGAALGSLSGYLLTTRLDDDLTLLPLLGPHETGLLVSFNW